MGAWSGRLVVITSGPTREPLDPVRFLTNASSGRMGFALAEEVRRRGGRAVVVSGPTALPDPRGVQVRRVTTGLEMRREVRRLSPRADVVIAAAAVSDWRFAKARRHKLKKGAGPLRLTLLPNPDIIKEVSRRRRPGSSQVLVGFALETRRALASAREKMQKKGLDMIVANGPASLSGERSEAALLVRGASPRRLPPLPKAALAREILSAVEGLWRARGS